MKIEEVLHLFTKASEALPDKSGLYIVICNNGTESWTTIQQFIANNGWYDYLHITHWLDISKLQRKEEQSDCDHENTVFQSLRCNVCKDCGDILEINI